MIGEQSVLELLRNPPPPIRTFRVDSVIAWAPEIDIFDAQAALEGTWVQPARQVGSLSERDADNVVLALAGKYPELVREAA
jgi:hypothetical protein